MKGAIVESVREGKAGSVRLVMWRAVVAAAFLGCVLFIWHNSLENAETSAERSGRVTSVVNKIVESLGQKSVTEHFVRKLAHFSEYGLEGVLAVLLFLAYGFHAGRYWWKVILTGMVTAVTDESLQFFSLGRAPGLKDVCIDMAGFLCGMLWMCAVRLLLRKACETWVQKKSRRRNFAY